MTIKYNDVYISDSYSIGSIYESNGPLRKYYNKIYDKDFYFGEKSFEKAESKILYESIYNIYNRNRDTDLVIAGDLQNQISASNYALSKINCPYLGIYSACATFGEGINIASTFLDSRKYKKIIVGTCSHNMVSERQFRNPTEYGAPKKKTSTFTSTGAASILLTREKSNIRVSSGTIGRVIDANIKDVNNMGAVMAKAAGDTIKRHLEDMKIDASYYDLILTGDLGIYGKKILIEYLKEFNIDISNNYNDCGLIIYNINKQNVFAGASGPGTSALVTVTYVLNKMNEGVYKRVLIVPTGAIFSPTRVFQKDSIPSIAYAFSLEVVD